MDPNVDNGSDTCDIALASAKNYLAYALQLLKTIFAKDSLGFVATPLLNALQTYVDGFLTATQIDASGTAATAVELMYLLRLVAPASYQTEIQTYIDKIRAFQATVQECTGKKDRMGSMSFMQMVLKLPAVAMDTARNCNVFNPLGCAPGNAVRTVVDRLGDLAQGARHMYLLRSI
ncbi:hypothetical protein BG000_001659 [Podila horticola]|nr:hypothetical protein BG000_001659 [Podila horticola]